MTLEITDSLSIGSTTKGKEDSHVYDSYSQIDSHELRRLRWNQAEASETSQTKVVLPEISRSLGHSVLSKHQHLLTDGALFLIDTYTCAIRLPNRPLWVHLLWRMGGLRHISTEWRDCANAFLAKVTLPQSKDLVTTQDPFEAYRFAQYDRALLFLSRREFPDDELRGLGLRLGIANGNLSAELLEDILRLPTVGFLKQSVVATYIVKAERASVPYDRDLLRYLRVDEKILCSIKDHNALLRACHILNSLNFVLMQRGDDESVRANLATMEIKLLPYLMDEWMHHIEGITEFHRSILCKRRGDTAGELFFLNKANILDRDFADYHYRIAQILHDRGDESAMSFYEKALTLGPPNFALVNDYGCLLNDLGFTEDVQSWEKVASFLYNV